MTMFKPMMDNQRIEDIQTACSYTMAWYLMSSFTDQDQMKLRVCKSMNWNGGLDYEIYAIKDGKEIYFQEIPRDDFTKERHTHFDGNKHIQLVNFFINCDDVEIEWDTHIEENFETFEKIHGEFFEEMSYSIDYFDLNGKVIDF